MGFGSLYEISPRWCVSTENYNEYKNKHYPNINDDDEKMIPDWF